MKVTIGPYSKSFCLYDLVEALCFWSKTNGEYPNWVRNIGEWLTYGEVSPDLKVGDRISLYKNREYTFLHKVFSFFFKQRKRKIDVRIDKWDVWSMDHTLAYIITPMLKELQKDKNGAPSVDNEDVPVYLRSLNESSFDHIDDKFFDRWNWVLDEMIFAFESKLDDSWEEQFESGESDTAFEKTESGDYKLVQGPNHTKKYDWEGKKKYQERMQNGFRLFGKYYNDLWT